MLWPEWVAWLVNKGSAPQEIFRLSLDVTLISFTDTSCTQGLDSMIYITI